MPIRDLTPEEGERLLSHPEICALEDGTEVMIKWHGGNGPHRYELEFSEGTEYPFVGNTPVVKTTTDPDSMLTKVFPPAEDLPYRSAPEIYREAAGVSERLRELAHETAPVGEVSSEVGVYDDGTYSVLVRHSEQSENADGDLQTLVHQWRYRSETDDYRYQRELFAPGEGPYNNPLEVDREPLEVDENGRVEETYE